MYGISYSITNSRLKEPIGVNVAPTDINLSSSSINENNSIGDTIGSFSTTDANAGDSFTYALVTGTGSTDNASFTIEGPNLKAAEVFDYETKSSYSIRVRSTDAGGLFFEKIFTITIGDISEVPMNETNLLDLGLSSSEIDERLIHLATLDLTGQVIDIRGNSPRTSASDDAVYTLTVTQDNQVWEDL